MERYVKMAQRVTEKFPDQLYYQSTKTKECMQFTVMSQRSVEVYFQTVLKQIMAQHVLSA